MGNDNSYKKECDIIWLDLYKEKDIYENILKEIEKNLTGFSFNKINLINEFAGNIANKEETMKKALPNLLKEIDKFNPKLIFILGNDMATFLLKNIDYLNPTVILINHPSYVYNFDKENIDLYINDVIEIIKNKLG